MYRIGFGFDSHRFVEGKPLMLGGVEVPHDRGLDGHSDADAPLHAVTDAILGAISAGDIGEIFPDTDPQWKDAPSSLFVTRAVEMASEEGYTIGNCDVTIVTQSPKLSPHKQSMRERIATLLGIDAGAVAVKAKTSEQMGVVGQGEGLLALAAVLLVKEE